MVLIEVSRIEYVPLYVNELDRDVNVALTEKYQGEGTILKRATYFHAREEEVDVLMETLAKNNPGMDINVYSLTKVGHCPAGEYVAKQVTKNGTLPA